MLRFTDDNRSSIREALLLLELMDEQKRKWKDEQEREKKQAPPKPEKFLGMEYKRLANVLFLLAPLIGIIQLAIYSALAVGLYRFLQIIIK